MVTYYTLDGTYYTLDSVGIVLQYQQVRSEKGDFQKHRQGYFFRWGTPGEALGIWQHSVLCILGPLEPLK